MAVYLIFYLRFRFDFSKAVVKLLNNRQQTCMFNPEKYLVCFMYCYYSFNKIKSDMYSGVTQVSNLGPLSFLLFKIVIDVVDSKKNIL